MNEINKHVKKNENYSRYILIFLSIKYNNVFNFIF